MLFFPHPTSCLDLHACFPTLSHPQKSSQPCSIIIGMYSAYPPTSLPHPEANLGFSLAFSLTRFYSLFRLSPPISASSSSILAIEAALTSFSSLFTRWYVLTGLDQTSSQEVNELTFCAFTAPQTTPRPHDHFSRTCKIVV